MNREAWLHAAVEELKPLFRGHGFEVPDLKVSVGWPSSGGLATRKRAIGQCWFGTMAADGKPQLFISPLLDDVRHPMGVLATLVHEVVHTVAGPDAKHGPKFKKIMLKVGLTGKPTATEAGEDLIVRLGALADKLGPFPHSRLVPIKTPKTQTTRMRKMECGDCGYVARASKKWIDVGALICPCNNTAMTIDLGLGEEGEGE